MDSSTFAARRSIAIWLLVMCALVFAMVLLGGVTRLTGSGLSMVHWKPLAGIVPPLDMAAWQAEFEHYKQYPEYQKINLGMTLDEFKSIFWFEFSHRLLGRFIGLAFALPFLFFLLTGTIGRAGAPSSAGLMVKLLIAFLLGGLQGLLGWYMVKSGLTDRPDVSQYRLTAHLGAAILIYGYMLWLALGLLSDPRNKMASIAPSANMALALCGLIFLQALAGGMVAGLDAGLVYNSWPLMGGRIIPEGIDQMSPWWINLFENAATVQFNHRMLAYLVGICGLVLWWRVERLDMPDKGVLLMARILVLVLIAQIMLGIATLLLAVPLVLGSAHQAGALILFSVALMLAHRLRH